MQHTYVGADMSERGADVDVIVQKVTKVVQIVFLSGCGLTVTALHYLGDREEVMGAPVKNHQLPPPRATCQCKDNACCLHTSLERKLELLLPTSSWEHVSLHMNRRTQLLSETPVIHLISNSYLDDLGLVGLKSEDTLWTL